MGTKNNPGKFDCFSKADPDEPMFILLGRDVTAYLTVLFWVQLRKAMGETEPEVLEEAEQCVGTLHSWARSRKSEEKMKAALQAFGKVINEIGMDMLADEPNGPRNCPCCVCVAEPAPRSSFEYITAMIHMREYGVARVIGDLCGVHRKLFEMTMGKVLEQKAMS